LFASGVFFVTILFNFVFVFCLGCVIVLLRSFDRFFLEDFVMSISFTAAEKALVVGACVTEQRRLARAINVQPNQGVKELLYADLRVLEAVHARISNEVVK